MHHLSIVQALSLWSDLELCYHTDRVIEFYDFRANPYSPLVSMAIAKNLESGIAFEEAKAAAVQAAETLCSLFQHFANTHDCKVEVQDCVSNEWWKPGIWMSLAPQSRYPVRIKRKGK